MSFIFGALVIEVHLCLKKSGFSQINKDMNGANSGDRPSLTHGGNICDHEIASLWHDGLQTDALQTRGQLLPLVVQHGRKLLEVALWSTTQLVLCLKSMSYGLLLTIKTQEDTGVPVMQQEFNLPL